MLPSSHLLLILWCSCRSHINSKTNVRVRSTSRYVVLTCNLVGPSKHIASSFWFNVLSLQTVLWYVLIASAFALIIDMWHTGFLASVSFYPSLAYSFPVAQWDATSSSWLSFSSSCTSSTWYKTHCSAVKATFLNHSGGCRPHIVWKRRKVDFPMVS